MAETWVDKAGKAARNVAGAPAALVEAARAVAEDAGDAMARARATVTQTASATDTPDAADAPLDMKKGYPDMATSFDTAAFTPTPEKLHSLFGDFQDRAKSGMEKSAMVVEELGEFARGNVEALMASGRAAAKGAEMMGQDAASYGRKSLDSATAAMKTFAAAKSPTELFRLQSEFAKSSFEEAIAEGSRFSETMLKLVGEIAQPLSTRVAMAADKIKTPA